MRNLTKLIAAVSLLVPASAYPLGIGDIKLLSALNQSLDAEIALLVSANESVSDIIVKLANPERFDEAGIPWNFFLSKIKFETITRKNGSAFVKLSTKEVLREPFLNFLVEVRWAKGTLFREFTVLVDPPVTYINPIIPVVDKANQTVENNKEEIVAINAVVDNTTSDEQYVRTNTSDTLWKIAQTTNTYNDISIEQMMLAIYDANPKAFFKANVNALKANQLLDIPEKEYILKLSKKQALAAFKKQNNVWNGRVSNLPENVPSAPDLPVSDPAEINAQLELEAPVEAEITELVGITGDAPVLAPSNDQLAVNISKESLALQARMEKMEQQLAMMQKMLTLKNEQIAVLQTQKGIPALPETLKIEDKKIAAEVDSKPEDSGVAKVDPPATITNPKVISKPKPEPKPIEKKKHDGVLDQDPMTWVLAGLSVGIFGFMGWLWWRKKKIEDATDTESMFATASEITLPDSSIEELSIPIIDDSSLYDVGTVGESSFLSEFTPSDFDAFDMDQNEVDPISEADVYLAYGRYQQAEDLMRQAIQDQPDRDECKLKLLEIFYSNENKDSFEKYASELVDSGKHNDLSFWDKVVEMGAELIPGSSLFTEQVGEKASFDAQESSNESALTENIESLDDAPQKVDETIDDVGFDLSVFDGDKVEPKEESEEQTDNSALEFDLSMFEVDDKVEHSADITDTDESSFKLAETENISLEDDLRIEETSEIDGLESIDFNAEAESNNLTITDSDLSPVKEIQDDLENIDLTLTSDLANVDAFNTESNEISPVIEPEKIDDFSFDFDLESPPLATDSVDEFNLDVSDLTDMDEMETKIDLAKAYIDMGDSEAALNIVEEIIEKGSSEQKQVAQTIMEQIKQ